MIRSLVTAKITGADIPGTLFALSQSEIMLLCTLPIDELTVQVTVKRLDYGKLQRICTRRGDRLTIMGKKGPYWACAGLRSRPALIAGILLILTATLYLPTRVLFIQVEGNYLVPTRKITEMAAQCGIGFGASRRAVRSEKMKNQLLEAMPELQWAGVNTRGCVAVISVRERAVQTVPEAEGDLGHIVALLDGIISQCTATEGTLLCTPGQAVCAGDILISGYTDTGLAIRAEAAQGEVYGHTLRKINAIAPQFSLRPIQTGAQMKKISLLIGKNRIKLWKDSGIWEGTCDRMYEEYYITLPGGFQLPFGVAVERYRKQSWVQQELSSAEVRELLETSARKYLQQKMIAGTLVREELSFSETPGITAMAGEYRCTELIGVRQRFQIGEYNGENN